MVTYLMLWTWTQPAIENVRDTVHRADRVIDAFKRHGVTVRELYWTEGQFDGFIVLEAEDEQTVAAAVLANDALGRIRTQTLRAFSEDEMKQIVSKIVEE